MANAAYPPAMRELDEVETAGQLLGIETIALKIRRLRIWRLISRHTMAAQMASTLLVSRSPVPIRFGSIVSRSPSGCPQ